MFLARTLSGRLLLLTVMIVMVIEILVFFPSVARYRETYLQERLQMAQIASLALLAADDAMVSEALEKELLENAEVSSIVLRRDFARQLVLQAPEGAMVAETFDLRGASFPTLLMDAVMTMFGPRDRTIRVIGEPVNEGGVAIEITMAERPLCEALIDFGQRILILSLIISCATGAVVFLICRRLIVRPMERVVDRIVAIQNNPEGAPATDGAGSSLTEIARAEAALGEMQTTVRGALLQKSRLAELGSAVAKISHDLRNMLASAQLMADRLETSTDPVVTRIGPKLIGSIDRAATLCVSTLKHGKAEEAPPEPRRISLQRLVDDVADAVFADEGVVSFSNNVAPGAEAVADVDQLFRVLANLARNARQAIESAGRDGGEVSITAESADGAARIVIADNGPGMPQKALDNLFQPFLGSARRGGTGLGLAIASELVAANGGALTLERSTVEGTVFVLTLPA
ncbi:MAG: HAMP domain-containing sensor histidine kinase [Pseudomonadota bacterium]